MEVWSSQISLCVLAKIYIQSSTTKYLLLIYMHNNNYTKYNEVTIAIVIVTTCTSVYYSVSCSMLCSPRSLCLLIHCLGFFIILCGILFHCLGCFTHLAWDIESCLQFSNFLVLCFVGFLVVIISSIQELS